VLQVSSRKGWFYSEKSIFGRKKQEKEQKSEELHGEANKGNHGERGMYKQYSSMHPSKLGEQHSTA